MNRDALVRAKALMNEGHTGKALLELKISDGLSAPEALKAITEFQEDPEEGVNKMLDEAFKEVSVFDPITVSVLQNMRTMGGLKTQIPADYEKLVSLAEIVHSSLAKMAQMGVNPSRIMAAYCDTVFPSLLDKATATEVISWEVKTVAKTLKDAVPVHSLHDDLLSIL